MFSTFLLNAKSGHKEELCLVTAKTVSNSIISKQTPQKMYQRIVEECSILRHIQKAGLKNVVRLYFDGLYDTTDPERKFLCTEYVTHDQDLSFFTVLARQEIHIYAELLLDALASLHSIDIVHGRISPDHVLHEPFDRKSVLTGLGYAQVVDKLIPRASVHNKTPEGLLSAKSDSWSAGIIIYMQLYRLDPAKFAATNERLCSEISQASELCVEADEFNEWLHNEYDRISEKNSVLLSTVRKLLRSNPDQRISCKEALNDLVLSRTTVHPFLQESDPDCIAVPGFFDDSIQRLFWPSIIFKREFKMSGKETTFGYGVKAMCDTPEGAALCRYLAWPICRREADRRKITGRGDYLRNSHLSDIVMDGRRDFGFFSLKYYATTKSVSILSSLAFFLHMACSVKTLTYAFVMLLFEGCFSGEWGLCIRGFVDGSGIRTSKLQIHRCSVKGTSHIQPSW